MELGIETAKQKNIQKKNIKGRTGEVHCLKLKHNPGGLVWVTDPFLCEVMLMFCNWTWGKKKK